MLTTEHGGGDEGETNIPFALLCPVSIIDVPFPFVTPEEDESGGNH